MISNSCNGFLLTAGLEILIENLDEFQGMEFVNFRFAAYPACLRYEISMLSVELKFVATLI
jgi:hypothetical protein